MEKNARFEHLITKQSFMNGVFTQYERDYIRAKGKRESVAACGIFCVKEAFSKALGVGILSVDMQKCEVRHSACGAPYLHLMSEKHIGLSAEISISHTDTDSIAICVCTVK